MMTLAHRRNHSLRFETEFDENQPYFVQSMDEEEFYESTTPSEDIWKKFQLLPTPPRSPGRDEIDDGFSPLITDTITSFHPAITEQLRLVSESLDDGLASPAPPTIFVGDINSNLIQDCMWSGLIETSLDSEKDISTPSKTVLSKDKSLPSKFPVTKSSKVPSSTTAEYGTGECVDPTAVFPYPLSDRMDLSPETPSDSEEEIDVVSVSEKQQKVSEITKIRITHNYSAPYSASLKRKSGLNLSLNTSSKKSKTEANIEEVKRVLQSIKTPSSHSSSRSSSKYSSRQNSRTGSRNSSRASSDSEDIDKRASHNVLERKRRTDLKNSFMRLRDNIPELECQERAAKVVILKKAVDYVEELQSDESSLQEEERILRRRNLMLLQKLRTLREDVLDL
ncbi:myc protein-like [Anneissia japonica]|uniref:myc protein-like n=1 Tax=Anneissia japonica TaxID=1529436 RepID=UPI0014255177|nr:myc protein-like [Anneissia japonica]XP_033112416.1 myc protein-like [Anneissia japonica]